MKNFRVIGYDECNTEFYVDTIHVPQIDGFSYEELAEIVLRKKIKVVYKHQFSEEINLDRFFVEPDFSTMSLSELEYYME